MGAHKKSISMYEGIDGMDASPNWKPTILMDSEAVYNGERYQNYGGKEILSNVLPSSESGGKAQSSIELLQSM